MCLLKAEPFKEAYNDIRTWKYKITFYINKVHNSIYSQLLDFLRRRNSRVPNAYMYIGLRPTTKSLQFP